LAWATIAWNVVEAVVAIGAGLEAGSLALVGFGLDSTIEVGSAAVILWQFGGQLLGSVTVAADSRQTWLCTYLSAVLLAGLVLNAVFGWWWADPAAGLVIAALAIREGREAWSGDSCCD
jgi:divalent metal cation (Fe/Co/Zn/Cd) transporter